MFREKYVITMAIDALPPSATGTPLVAIILTVWKNIFPGLILGLGPAIEGRRYKVTPSFLILWAQT